MNIENIDKAIAVMKRAQEHQENFHMRDFQCAMPKENGIRTWAQTEAELHSCGNTACFAGYLALSPEWQTSEGCFLNDCVVPAVRIPPFFLNGADAVAHWLDISTSLAETIVYGDLWYRISSVVEKDWLELKPQDIIIILEAIKAGELK